MRDATPGYRAQPYQQFAAVLRASGHEREVRTVLMAQRRDQLRGPLASRTERAWGRITGITLGYGYQPWRALIGLLATVICALVLSLMLGMHGALTHPGGSTAATDRCSIVEQIGFGLDASLPLIKVSTSDCTAPGTTLGEALTALDWALQAIAWAFTTLFVAGFTSAVRKT